MSPDRTSLSQIAPPCPALDGIVDLCLTQVWLVIRPIEHSVYYWTRFAKLRSELMVRGDT